MNEGNPFRGILYYFCLLQQVTPLSSQASMMLNASFVSTMSSGFAIALEND